MHYCQSCGPAIALEPRDGQAVCPRCGARSEAPARQPLFVIAGASAAGKSAVLPPLARQLSGQCVPFGVDWLLDAAGGLSGTQPIDWAGFRSAWLAVAHGAAQSGLPGRPAATADP